MKWYTLTTRERDGWREAAARLPQTDVYFLPEYHQAYELNGDGEAQAFVAECDGQVLFYPFFLRPIEKVAGESVGGPWYDIETVYGYGGPLCTTADPAFLTEAWACFAAWCAERRVVAEFVRFHPLLGNHRYADGSCRLAHDRDTLAIRLDCSEEQLWEAYPSVQRNMVRKALKSGLVCGEAGGADGMAEFRRLYRGAMAHAGARRYYDFSEPYFDSLSAGLGPGLKLFAVWDQGRMVAASLLLVHGEYVHYHLAASDPTCRNTAPNNLLVHAAALWGREQGLSWLHLGGGRTSDPQDSLYRFKASLSRERFPFFIGKRVHNRDVYEELCSTWRRRRGVSPPPYFLLYRLGDER
jgi:hypothetical protein